ncbi:MAG TPA: FtsX-like permease family protein [Jiangellales bacterium]|nr:FtsX-like permease family protein [Jiangellales bacterium]
MTAATVLAALVALLLLPLAVTALRQRTLVTMAMRNIRRRRGEAALVVAGALLGTAIITSAFVLGDVVEGSFSDAARTQYGPVDIVVTTAGGADITDVGKAVEAAGIDGIDGLLTTTTSTGTLEAPQHDAAVPQVTVMELDVAAARGFGAHPAITGLDTSEPLAADGIIVNRRTAEQLGVQAGDSLRLHAYDATVDLRISQVAAEVGLAGYAGAIVAPDTLGNLAEASAIVAAPPSTQMLISLDGAVFDTRDLSDGVGTDLREAVAGMAGVQIDAPKATMLDYAESQGAGLTQIFTMIGSFSVMAGILLLINLFVMLAEERKTELGMLRAVGFTRRRLTRAFAIEASLYAVVAAAAGAAAGIGIGWLVAVMAGPIFGTAGQGGAPPLVIEPVSLAIGAGTGLLISLLTIWATSLRIARLNIIRAIRDLPEPKITKVRKRTLVLGAVGILAGAAVGFAGYLGDNAIALSLGVPVAAFSASPLLRRLLPERPARLVIAGTVLGWGLAVYPLFPDVMAAGDMMVFVVQGVVLTAGAVSLASSIDRVWAFTIDRLARGGRGLAPRLGIAYPLARRFRTSMLLGMFSLVIFTVTIMTVMSASIAGNTDATVERVAAGFDVVLDTNPANPVTVAALTERPDVAAVAGLISGVATFDAAHLDVGRSWPVTSFDADLLEQGAPGLFRHDPVYASDEAAYRAVLDDPSLAIVPEDFLVAGLDDAVPAIGDTFSFVDPATGRSSELTIAGVGEADWLGNGALVNGEVTEALFGDQQVSDRFYIAAADGADAAALAAAVNADLLAHGADARTFTTMGTAGMGEMLGFIALLRGFLGLGLLVGIAGLGVVMVRAVRERRHEIGMLRAMGFRTGIVRAAMLSESGLIAVQGTVIGAVLGLLTTRQLLSGSDSFGDVPPPFVVPWVGLLVILGLPLVASLAATAWPASRAAAIKPAVALRAAD